MDKDSVFLCSSSSPRQSLILPKSLTSNSFFKYSTVLDNLSKIAKYLKEFEIKDLGKIRLYLGLELKHKENGIIIPQLAYIRKVLKRFNMDKSHPLSTPIVV